MFSPFLLEQFPINPKHCLTPSPIMPEACFQHDAERVGVRGFDLSAALPPHPER